MIVGMECQPFVAVSVHCLHWCGCWRSCYCRCGMSVVGVVVSHL